MLKLKNYWEENSAAVKKLLLWLRGIIVMITGSAYIQGEVKLAFYIMVGGGLIDGMMQLLPPETKVKPPQNTGNVTAIALILMLFTLGGCRVIKPEVDTVKTDSTYTTYKQVDISIKGAMVNKGLNMDSLYHVVLMAVEQRQADSIANLKQELQYKQDSIAALKAGKAIPAAPVLITSKPIVSYVTDPQTKAQLSYWIDQYGKLQLGCQSKDQVVQTLQTQVDKLTRQVTTQKVIVPTTPTWNWVIIAVVGVLLLISLLINFINRKA